MVDLYTGHRVLLTPTAIRLRKMERLLRSGNVVPSSRLKTVCRGSRATFKRDLDTLRLDFGADIVWVREEWGYRLRNPGDWAGVTAAITEQLRQL